MACMGEVQLTHEAIFNLFIGEGVPAQDGIPVLHNELDNVASHILAKLGLKLEIQTDNALGCPCLRRHDRRGCPGVGLACNLHVHLDIGLALGDVRDAKTACADDQNLDAVRRGGLRVCRLHGGQQGHLMGIQW